MKYLIYDGSQILADSLGLKQHMMMRKDPKDKKSEIIGGSLEFFSIMRDTSYKFPDHFPVVIWDGGINPLRAKYKTWKDPDDKDPVPHSYRSYNEYYHISKSLSPDSPTLEREQYLKQKDIIKEILAKAKIMSLEIDDLEHEDLIAMMTEEFFPGDGFVVVTDDDDAQYLMTPNCELYRPYEDTYVQYDSYVKNFGITNILDAARQRAFSGEYLDWVKGCCEGIGATYQPYLLKILDHIGWDNPKIHDPLYIENLCNELDIPFRKKYCNFNKDAYDANRKILCVREEKLWSDIRYNMVLKVKAAMANSLPMKIALVAMYEAIALTDHMTVQRVVDYHIKHRFSC